MSTTWRERMRIAGKLLKNRPLTDLELPTAAAVIQSQRAARWLPWLYSFQLPVWGLNALIRHGAARWMNLGLVVICVVLIPSLIYYRRRLEHSYERQATVPTLDR